MPEATRSKEKSMEYQEIKKMEMEKNFLIMVIYNLKGNTFMEEDGMERDMIIMEMKNLK